jgi:7-carboxy-7-deazaguanine synthase
MRHPVHKANSGGAAAMSACKAKIDEAWEAARDRRLKIAELFVSVQGESSWAGLPTTFVRLTGCALRCDWCDSSYAFHRGQWATLRELDEEIDRLGVRRVCVTGGEPLLQPSVVPLMRRLVERGYAVSIETGGDQDVSVVPPGVKRVVDIKLPGSGMSGRMDPANAARLGPGDEIKLIVRDRADYQAARGLVRERLAGFPGEILLGAVTGELDPGLLAEWALGDRLPVRLQVQLHKVLWPGRTRGI